MVRDLGSSFFVGVQTRSDDHRDGRAGGYRMRRLFGTLGILLLSHVSLEKAAADDCPSGKASSGKSGALVSANLTSAWIRAFWQLVIAPKVAYNVEALEVYRNGVWASFSITNKCDKRLYFDTSSLNVPVEYMELTDSDGGKWEVPHFQGRVTVAAPDSFVSIDSGKTVNYRSKLSTVNNPIQLADRPREELKRKPKELEYKIAVWWSQIYSELTQDEMKQVRTAALGKGKVAVKWVDRDYPSEWGLQQRKN
jgi:hypothetical protein